MTESVVNLIKKAQQAGEPLFKGDVAGHEFHGNQWASTVGSEKYHDAVDAGEKASEASRKAEKTGSVSDHARAREANNAAALAHREAAMASGDLKDKEFHYKAAESHERQGEYHNGIVRAAPLK